MKRLNLIDKAFLLKRTALFGSLDLDLLLAIADKFNLASCDAGDLIFPSGQDVHRLYVVAKGTVVLRDASHKPLAHLGTAAYFGDEALFNEKPSAYEAISETDTVLLTMTRAHLSTVISECPAVAVSLLQEYASSIPVRPRLEQEKTR